ncbi:MAG: hypothetical protein GYA24_20985 [Candidatus Lokiarchaeota archaeon]|nr:hypothetical protein [Candidatus Lokiarchaeota archaeon]
MGDDGFFSIFVKDVEKVINDHFSEGAIIDVRYVRRLMGIPSKNRSKTAFVARALKKLSNDGLLSYFDQKTAKRYKKRVSGK